MGSLSKSTLSAHPLVRLTSLVSDIKTTLVSKTLSISTLTVSISDTTLQGLTVICADGLSSALSCTIQIIGE